MCVAGAVSSNVLKLLSEMEIACCGGVVAIFVARVYATDVKMTYMRSGEALRCSRTGTLGEFESPTDEHKRKLPSS
jgi:hypothetical protein